MVDPTTCSSDTLRLWSFLPEFAQQLDAVGDGVNGSYQFLSWLEGAVAGGSLYNTSASGLQALDDLCRDDISPGWSKIMDVTRCPTYALPWLAQFVGVRFTGSTVNDDSAMRLAILQESNFSRGTAQAITASVQPFLSPTGRVNIIERSPDTYSFTVQVYGAIGILTYSIVAQNYPTYPVLAAHYPLYSNMTGLSGAPVAIAAAIQASTPAGLNSYVQFF